MKFLFVFILLLISISLAIAQDKDRDRPQGNKRNYEACSRNEECASRRCKKKRCAPLSCRNDRACLKAGLTDHYCKSRGPKVFSSECIPKKGRGQLCMRSRVCLSNKCLPVIFRCA